MASFLTVRFLGPHAFLGRTDLARFPAWNFRHPCRRTLRQYQQAAPVPQRAAASRQRCRLEPTLNPSHPQVEDLALCVCETAGADPTPRLPGKPVVQSVSAGGRTLFDPLQKSSKPSGGTRRVDAPRLQHVPRLLHRAPYPALSSGIEPARPPDRVGDKVVPTWAVLERGLPSERFSLFLPPQARGRRRREG